MAERKLSAEVGKTPQGQEGVRSRWQVAIEAEHEVTPPRGNLRLRKILPYVAIGAVAAVMTTITLDRFGATPNMYLPAALGTGIGVVYDVCAIRSIFRNP